MSANSANREALLRAIRDAKDAIGYVQEMAGLLPPGSTGRIALETCIAAADAWAFREDHDENANASASACPLSGLLARLGPAPQTRVVLGADGYHHCTACGAILGATRRNFCSNCGAEIAQED